jgi:hypothetical protein
MALGNTPKSMVPLDQGYVVRYVVGYESDDTSKLTIESTTMIASGFMTTAGCALALALDPC